MPENCAVRAMASQVAPAPFALAAGQIDFADDAAAHKLRPFGLDHLADEFVSGRA